MKLFIKNNWLYLLPYILALSFACYLLLLYDKLSLHIHINKLVGNAIIDNFFKYITHIGDGVFVVVIGILALFFNIRNGIYIISTYITSGLITALLKNFVFQNVYRPHFVFGFYFPDTKINYIDGVNMMGLNSFPSGHATSAFAVFTCLAFISSNKLIKFSFFVLAIITAFSRTYLSQHWLADISAGSLIGVTAAIIFYFIFMGASKLPKLNKPLFNPKIN